MGERMLILATLARFEGDKKRTAETLGISLKTLYNRLAVYQAGSLAGESLSTADDPPHRSAPDARL